MLSVRNLAWLWRDILLLALTAMLAGCGTAPPPSMPTSIPQEPVTLRFGYYTNMADYEPLAEEFHELHPHITVELVTAFIDGQRTALEVLDGADLDVIRWGTDYLAPERRERLSSLPRTASSLSADMYPGAMEALQVDGIQWGVPAGIDLAVAYYAPLFFQEAQATPPTAGWTLDDLVAAADAINDIADTVYGFCSTPDDGHIFIFTELFGGRVFDDLQHPTRPTLNMPANAEAIWWYASLRQEYGVIPDPDEFQRRFAYEGVPMEGAVAGGACGLWFASYAERNGALWSGGRLAWGRETVMLPLPSGQETFNEAGVHGYYILARSQHPQEAWEWISFLMEHQEASGQMIPPRLSHINSEAYAARVGENVAQVARGLPDDLIIFGVDTVDEQVIGAITDLYVDVTERAVRGELNSRDAVQSALDDAQRQAEELFLAGPGVSP